MSEHREHVTAPEPLTRQEREEIRLPTPAERDSPDLLELYAQLRSRALRYPASRDLHDAHEAAREELLRRLGQRDRLLSHAHAGEALPPRILAMCKARGWSLAWTERGAYLHLEASELVEALRGKRGDPTAEAADVLLVLMSITEANGIAWPDVLDQLRRTVGHLETAPRYAAEEASEPPSPRDLQAAAEERTIVEAAESERPLDASGPAWCTEHADRSFLQCRRPAGHEGKHRHRGLVVTWEWDTGRPATKAYEGRNRIEEQS